MIAVNFSTARNRFRHLCDKAASGAEPVIVTRPSGKNVVLVSAERYRHLEKAERNADYLKKIDRGFAQVRAGYGIVKSMEELEGLEKDGV